METNQDWRNNEWLRQTTEVAVGNLIRALADRGITHARVTEDNKLVFSKGGGRGLSLLEEIEKMGRIDMRLMDLVTDCTSIEFRATEQIADDILKMFNTATIPGVQVE